VFITNVAAKYTTQTSCRPVEDSYCNTEIWIWSTFTVHYITLCNSASQLRCPLKALNCVHIMQS